MPGRTARSLSSGRGDVKAPVREIAQADQGKLTKDITNEETFLKDEIERYVSGDKRDCPPNEIPTGIRYFVRAKRARIFGVLDDIAIHDLAKERVLLRYRMEQES